jgi:dihydrofolate reductase
MGSNFTAIIPATVMRMTSGGEMGNVVIDMSMSLDGYIAAPNDNPQQWAGGGGMSLHNWAFDDPSLIERVHGRLVEETDAVIMGRRSYDNGVAAWGGKGPLGEVPCFVVTHRPPASPGPAFTFVPDGIESALAKAQEVAGDKRIALMGAELDQQYLAAGLVDEPRHHGRSVERSSTSTASDTESPGVGPPAIV